MYAQTDEEDSQKVPAAFVIERKNVVLNVQDAGTATENEPGRDTPLVQEVDQMRTKPPSVERPENQTRSRSML